MAAAANCNINNPYGRYNTQRLRRTALRHSPITVCETAIPGCISTVPAPRASTYRRSPRSRRANKARLKIGVLVAANGYAACAGHSGDNTPHVFWTYTILGTYTCHEDDSISLTVGSNYNLSTKSQFSNGNPTNTWGFSFNTTLLDQHNVGFTNSANQTNGERHRTGRASNCALRWNAVPWPWRHLELMDSLRVLAVLYGRPRRSGLQQPTSL